MTFTVETDYTSGNMAVMARALRKTLRKRRSRRFHVFGWVVTALAAALLAAAGPAFDLRTVVTLAAMAAIVLALLFEDRINGYVAKRRMLPGMERAEAVFTEEGFTSATEIGRTEWRYDKILLVAETEDFFVFIFSTNHAQLYDKRNLRGGTAEEFRRFLEERTGKAVQPV